MERKKKKMYNVYFENRYEERIFLDCVKSEEIYSVIEKDIKTRAQPSFKWYYTRTWTRDDGEKVYDVGSHSEFYIAVPVT